MQEMLSRLAPLASSLEVLDLGGKRLGGTITSDIAVFTKLKKLDLSNMDLEGRRSAWPCRTFLPSASNQHSPCDSGDYVKRMESSVRRPAGKLCILVYQMLLEGGNHRICDPSPS